jgi:putative tryptophan/tyrosine transport system substrate-binding protein
MPPSAAPRASTPAQTLAMNRCAFVTGLGAVLAAPVAAEAQPAGKVRRIGYLLGGSPTASARAVEAFRQGLRDLGWIEGQNIIIDYRFAEGRLERLPDLAAELVRLNVDVIVAGPTPPAVAAKNATATIPIVMTNAAEPVEVGLIASLAWPGGNVTGLSWSVNLEIIGKGIELLHEAVPKARRVAVLANLANPGNVLAVKEVKAAARSSGVQLEVLNVRGPGDFDNAFAVMAKQRARALLVVAGSMLTLHRQRVLDYVIKNRLPSMHQLREEVEAGGLMSYGPNLAANQRRAATFVDKILNGAPPATLPVEQPTKYELVINLKTAKTFSGSCQATFS